MKAKKLIAGVAALTLALASAFAVLPAGKVSAASSVDKHFSGATYTPEGEYLWSSEFDYTEFTLDKGNNLLAEAIPFDYEICVSLKARGAGTGKLSVTFTSLLEVSVASFGIASIVGNRQTGTLSDDEPYYFEALWADSFSTDSVIYTCDLTFDEQGKLTRVDPMYMEDDGKLIKGDPVMAPASGFLGFGITGEAKSVSATFTPSGASAGTGSSNLTGTSSGAGANTSAGTSTAKPAATSITPVPSDKGNSMYRMYNPNSGEHFYTANVAEGNKLLSAGWKYEGVTWTAPKTSKTPVYRLYNPNSGDHHYTTNPAEKSMLTGNGWKDEGIGWYSDDNKGVPVYRQYNKNAKTGSHNYTANLAENDMLVKNGWKAEGISWYGVK